MAAKTLINTLLEQGVLRPPKSNYASPFHLAPKKKKGEWRPCGVYKGLNAITVHDQYPLKLIQDLFPMLHGKKVFSAIDLVQAYYHIPMAEEDIPKTAITTPFGLYEFVVMPFGLRCATQTFQRFMDMVLRDLDFDFCYVDDILVFSESHDQHQQHLQIVFDKLRQYGLTINSSKCQFGQSELTFLGYHVSEAGYKPPQYRVDTIVNYPKPQTIKQMRRFLGMINYYRTLIPHAAHLLKPLNAYLKDSRKNNQRKVNWTPEAEDSFKEAKETLATIALTTYPAPDAPLALRTDASDTCIGAALEQCVNGKWTPMGFFSRKLSDTEQRYSTYDRELLAIFAAIKYFKHQLDCREFVIATDHKPLIYAHKQKSENISPRQRRQLDHIFQHSTKIVHVKGAENVVADALSRINTIDMPTVQTHAT